MAFAIAARASSHCPLSADALASAAASVAFCESFVSGMASSMAPCSGISALSPLLLRSLALREAVTQVAPEHAAQVGAGGQGLLRGEWVGAGDCHQIGPHLPH